MALDGIAPLIVITFKVNPPSDVFGPPPEASFLQSLGVFPIPIYLSEEITGVFVDNESSGIDVTTKVDALSTKGIDGQVQPPQVSQNSADSQVTINLSAKRGSIMMTAILALMDMIVERLVSKEYSIHYLNGSTAIFGAKLHRFGKSNASGSELISMELVLSTASKEPPTPKVVAASVPKDTAAIPLN